MTTIGSDSPLVTFVAGRAGTGLALLLSLVVVVAIFANMLTMTIALSRFVFATGRGGIWPARLAISLARLNRHDVPVAATALLVIAAMVLLFLSERTLLIVLSAELISPLLVALAVLVGRRRAKWSRYVAPAHPLLPLICVVLASLFLLLEWNESQTGRLGLIAMATVVTTTVIARMIRLRRGNASGKTDQIA